MSFDSYKASEPPVRPEDLPLYLSQELRRIESIITSLAQRHDVQFADATADASSAEVIVCDASAGGFSVTLPGASASLGTRYLILKKDAINKVIIRSSDGGINGSGSSTLSAQYQQAVLFSDGTQWFKR